MTQGCDLSVFEYMYRDAGNWKTFDKLLMEGNCEGVQSVLAACLDWGNQFVAEQVDVPPLYEKHFADCGEGPSDLDHAFHEFICLRPATEEEQAGIKIHCTLPEFVTRMQKAAARWDVTLSPYCDY
ncbi:MAG: hypothetical protein ACRDRQ_20410 [Pseudonocardiaceae bacterium]